MKIYVLSKQGYNGNETTCVSEDINKIRTSVCEDFDANEDYPEFEVWEDGKMIYQTGGDDVLKAISKDIESMRSKQECTGSKSFSTLQIEVGGHTKYLQGIDLPIMINSIIENDNYIPSEVSEMHIGIVNGNQTLLITPEILSLPD